MQYTREQLENMTAEELKLVHEEVVGNKAAKRASKPSLITLILGSQPTITEGVDEDGNPQTVVEMSPLAEEIAALFEEDDGEHAPGDDFNPYEGDDFEGQTDAEVSAQYDDLDEEAHIAAKQGYPVPGAVDMSSAIVDDGDVEEPTETAPKGKSKKAKGEGRKRKLTDDQVREMRTMRTEENLAYAQIAKKFGVSGVFARNVILGLLYGDVE